jgi:hypothetical protein
MWQTVVSSRQRILFDLFWPATAGNVAWSFYSVLVKAIGSAPAPYASALVVLALMSLYLAANWLRTAEHDVDAGYFWADAAHTGTIILFSIALTEGKPWAPLALAAMFAVTALGHASNAWRATRPEGAPAWPLVCANALGLVVMACGWWLVPEAQRQWTLPAALAAVLVAWLGVRSYWERHPERFKPRARARQKQAEAQEATIRRIVEEILTERAAAPAGADARGGRPAVALSP